MLDYRVTKYFVILLLFLNTVFISCSKTALLDTVQEGDALYRELSIIITSPVSSDSPPPDPKTVTGDLTDKLFEVKGTATDKIGIKKVEVKVNDGEYVTALGAEQWKAGVRLEPGENTITARVVNTAEEMKSTSITVKSYFIKIKNYDALVDFRKIVGKSQILYYQGKFIVMGGHQKFQLSNLAYTYDPVNQSDQLLGEKIENKVAAGCAGVHTGTKQIFQVSGMEDDKVEYLLEKKERAREEYHIYDLLNPPAMWPATSMLILEDTIPLNYYFARTAAACGQYNNIIYFYGGKDKFGYVTDTIWAFDMDTQTVNLIRTTGKFVYNAASVVYNNKIWIFGGVDGSGTVSRDISVFDPQTNGFLTYSDRLSNARYGAGAALIEDKVYLLGGKTNGGITIPTSSGSGSIEAVDLLALSSSTVGLTELPEPMSYLGVGTDGQKIYVFNGFDEDDNPIDARYIYYPLLDQN